jgi:hypothetical protein
MLFLRAGDRLAQKLSLRHARHGPGVGDVVSAIFKAPFALIRSAFVMALIAPLGLLVGFGVLFGTVATKPGWGISQSFVAGIAAFVVVTCLGPGSGGPRRQLGRIWGSALPSRGPALIALAIVGIATFFLVAFGISQAPVMWPLNIHNTGIHGLHDLKTWIESVTGR